MRYRLSVCFVSVDAAQLALVCAHCYAQWARHGGRTRSEVMAARRSVRFLMPHVLSRVMSTRDTRNTRALH